MREDFFKRILHLIDNRPKEGKRLIGIGPVALWELQQRIGLIVETEEKKQANAPERKRQAGGGRKKGAEVLCRILVVLLYLRQHWTMQGLGEAVKSTQVLVFTAKTNLAILIGLLTVFSVPLHLKPHGFGEKFNHRSPPHQ